ncbi:MAG: 50S ribosomal protein L10, partial [Eubacteriales bacterium]|nr:50S ribosomal protein L10 [Eubacteriales bacterium]
IEGLDDVLNGPSAFAFGMSDPVSPAKIVNDFITKNKTEALQIKAGLMGTEILSDAQIKELATVPSREVLLARLLGSLQSSIAGFVRVLDAIAKKNSEDTAAAPEA